MTSRRSRLQVKPNIGPKLGLQRSGTKPDVKRNQEPSKPDTSKKEELNEKVSQSEPVQEKEKKEPVKIVEKPGHFSESKESTDSIDLNKAISEEKVITRSTKESGDVQEQKSEKKPEVRPKLRSRFPKAKPNLANIGRPERKPVQPKAQTQAAVAKSVEVEDDPTPELLTPTKVELKTQDNSEDVAKETPKDERQLSVIGRTDITNEQSPPATVLESEASSDEESVVDEKPAERSIFDKPLTPILKHEKRPLRKSFGGKKKSRVLPSIDEPPDRTKMRMIDLIYWNPSSNPMKKKVVKEKPQEQSTTPDKQDTASQEKGKGDTTKDAAEEEEDSSLFVPQVKIGPDGNIIVNESSLVIDNKISDEPMEPEVIEEDESTVNYTSFREKRSKSSWSEIETKKFYKALSTVGTDFSLMLNLFPSRTRQEIKNKFKKEEKQNRNEVDKAIRNRTLFDMTDFEKFEQEAVEEERLRKEKLEAKKAEKADQSKQKVHKRKKAKDDIKENKNIKRRKKKRRSKAVISDDDAENTDIEDAESFMSDGGEENQAPLPRHLSDKVKEVVDILVDLRQGRRPPLPSEGDVSDAESEAPSEAPSEAQSVTSELSVFVPKSVRTILSKKTKRSNVEENRTVDNEIQADDVPSGDIGDLVNNVMSDLLTADKSQNSTPQKETVTEADETAAVADEVAPVVVDTKVPKPNATTVSTSLPVASQSRVMSSDVQQMDIPESLLPVINQAGGADKVQIVLVHDTDAVTGRTMVHVYVLPKTAEEISIGGSTVQLTPTKNRPQDSASKCSTSSQDGTVSQCSTSGQVTISHCATSGIVSVSQTSTVQNSQGVTRQQNSESVPVTFPPSTVPPIPPSPATPFQRLSSKSVTLAQTGTHSAIKQDPSTSVSQVPVSTLLTPGVSSISSPLSTNVLSSTPLGQSLSSAPGLSTGLTPALSPHGHLSSTLSPLGMTSTTHTQVVETPSSSSATSASRVCLFKDDPGEANTQVVVKKEG